MHAAPPSRRCFSPDRHVVAPRRAPPSRGRSCTARRAPQWRCSATSRAPAAASECPFSASPCRLWRRRLLLALQLPAGVRRRQLRQRATDAVARRIPERQSPQRVSCVPLGVTNDSQPAAVLPAGRADGLAVWNVSQTRRVIGPGLPPPTTWPSISRMAVTSTAVPVKNNSSAVITILDRDRIDTSSNAQIARAFREPRRA